MIATARSGASAAALQQLAASSGGRLHITDLDSAQPESIQIWAAAVQAKTGHVDVSGAGRCPACCQRAERARCRRRARRRCVPCGAPPLPQRRPLLPLVPVQLLINNAGAMEMPKPFGQVPASDLADMFALNAAGEQQGARRCLGMRLAHTRHHAATRGGDRRVYRQPLTAPPLALLLPAARWLACRPLPGHPGAAQQGPAGPAGHHLRGQHQQRGEGRGGGGVVARVRISWARPSSAALLCQSASGPCLAGSQPEQQQHSLASRPPLPRLAPNQRSWAPSLSRTGTSSLHTDVSAAGFASMAGPLAAARQVAVGCLPARGRAGDAA